MEEAIKILKNEIKNKDVEIKSYIPKKNINLYPEINFSEEFKKVSLINNNHEDTEIIVEELSGRNKRSIITSSTTSTSSRLPINNSETEYNPNNDNIGIFNGKFPELEKEVFRTPKREVFETFAQHKRNNFVFSMYIKKELTPEEELYQNNILFNTEHERFKKSNGTSIPFNEDPLIFERGDEKWPDYVKYIYYTKDNFHEDRLVQLSRLSNLYLNKCFTKQPSVLMTRTGYYSIYYLYTKSKNKTQEEVKNMLLTKEFLYDNSYIFNETFYNDDNYNKIYIYQHRACKDLIKYPVNSIQPTNLRYKNYYDYVPVCGFVQDNLLKLMGNSDTYINPRKCYMSNICFHNIDTNCHHFTCAEHNFIKNKKMNTQTSFHVSYPEHRGITEAPYGDIFWKPLYIFNKNQLLDVRSGVDDFVDK